jgi:tetratricopeptide (TPR) repeat protein
MLQFVVFDWDEVDAAYRAAIALNPQNPVPYHRYTDYLVLTLRPERAAEMAAKAIQQDALDSSSMHAVGLAAIAEGDYNEAVRAFGEWNRYHPNSRWSYIKYALALSMDGQCDAALDPAAQVQAMLGDSPPLLMDSWIAWGHKLCGRNDAYGQAAARLQQARAADPDNLNPGFAYFLALEGDADGLVEFLTQVADTRNSFTVFVNIFAIPELQLPVADELPSHAGYQALLERLGFAPYKPHP